jgi:hypothetical protein
VSTWRPVSCRSGPFGALLLSAVLASATTASSVARAEAPSRAAAEEASRRFKSGVTFYKEKSYAAALVEFKRAYELVPNYVVLYNIGQSARELKDYAGALVAFEKYLLEGGAKAAHGKEVTSAVEDLRRKVGRIAVVTSAQGAEIAVDDVPVGTAPLASPVVANVGRHKVSLSATGAAPLQKVVDVASMEETTVTLEPPRPAEPKMEAAPPPPKPGPRVAAWVMLGTTGATAIAAGVTGGLALSAHSNLKTALGTFPGNPTAIADAQTRTRTLAIATDVLGGITIAGAVTTLVLFLVPQRASDQPTAALSFSPSGVALRGAF